MAVIGDFNYDLIALMVGIETQRALRALAGARAFFRSFNAVADGVAENVHERLSDGVEDALVEIGVSALNYEFDFLAALVRDIAHGARETAEELIDGHHADFHDRVLEIAQDARLKGHDIAELSTQSCLSENAARIRPASAEAWIWRE